MIVEEVFLDPNQVTHEKCFSSTSHNITDKDVTASGAPTMADTKLCIKRQLV